MRQDGKLCDTDLCHLFENSAETGAMEGWPSGLRRTPGKRVGVKAPPGFESPSLRHTPYNVFLPFTVLKKNRKSLLQRRLQPLSHNGYSCITSVSL